MKAQPTVPQLLSSAQRMLAEAASHWAGFHDSIAEVLEVPISSGWAAGTRSSDVSDPTANVALQGFPAKGTAPKAGSRLFWSTKQSEAEAQALEVHGAVKNLLNMIGSRPVVAIDPKLKRLARCSDPVCEELVVAKGMCARHWKAARRAELKEAQA